MKRTQNLDTEREILNTLNQLPVITKPDFVKKSNLLANRDMNMREYDPMHKIAHKLFNGFTSDIREISKQEKVAI